MLVSDLVESVDVDLELVNAAKEHFGITDDPNEAGYLLQDGTLLDLSGRHIARGFMRDEAGRNVQKSGRVDAFAGRREIDHRQLGGLAQSGTGGTTEAMHAFMDRASAVRILPGAGFSFRRMPTARQIAMMVWMGRLWDETLHLDGNHNSRSVAPPITPVKMTRAIVALGLQP